MSAVGMIPSGLTRQNRMRRFRGFPKLVSSLFTRVALLIMRSLMLMELPRTIRAVELMPFAGA